MNWTVDVPVAALPELPPLPQALAAALSDALARPAAQQPPWPTRDYLDRVRALLESVPPIAVPKAGSTRSRPSSARSPAARPFLQGGDCAETFVDDAEQDPRLRGKWTLLQMAVVLTYGTSMPVVKLGRIAGQYAKPAARTPTPRACCPTAATWSTGSKPEARAEPGRLVRASNAAAAMDTARAITSADASPTCTACTSGTWTSYARRARAALRAGGDRDRPQPALHVRLWRRRQLPAHRRAVRQPRDAGDRLRARAAAPRRGPPVPALRAPSCGSATARASSTAPTSRSRR